MWTLEMHLRVSNACIIQFNEKHGQNHDQRLYSKQAYNYLVNIILDPHNFKEGPQFDNCIFARYEELVKYVVYKCESDTILPIYNRVLASKNKKIKQRVNELESLSADYKDKDVEYMNIFINIALERKSKDINTNTFVEFMKNHKTIQVRNDLLEAALCMCTIC